MGDNKLGDQMRWYVWKCFPQSKVSVHSVNFRLIMLKAHTHTILIHKSSMLNEVSFDQLSAITVIIPYHPNDKIATICIWEFTMLQNNFYFLHYFYKSQLICDLPEVILL